MENGKKASLIAYGPCSNAGDVLIYKTILQLFKNDLVFDYRHARQDRLRNLENNIIIGPGGLLSGSYKPDEKPDELVIRFLNQNFIEEIIEKKYLLLPQVLIHLFLITLNLFRRKVVIS